MRIAASVVMWQYTDRKSILGKTFDWSRVLVPISDLTIK
jgi:hypothetical protein